MVLTSRVCGAAEVVAVGPGLSVTVKLDGLKFRSIKDEKSVLTVTGTIQSPANPWIPSTTSGDVGTTGKSSGGVSATLRPRVLRRR